MREICEIDGDADNYAWAFDGVPEENSIFLRFGEVRMEFPAIDVVFYRPKELLGSRVHARFGDEFPIRFDFLDTVGGGRTCPCRYIPSQNISRIPLGCITPRTRAITFWTAAMMPWSTWA